MSDHIPFEIQIEIMKRFPVKSLMRFRSVSKHWKSLIDSSRFVSDYSIGETQRCLFIMSDDPSEGGMRYVSIVDDDNFPKQMCDMSAILPNSAKQSTTLRLVGSSQGLLCLYTGSSAIIWNPWIRKSVTVIFPNFDNGNFERVVGFGVCPKTSDPKLVRLSFPQKSLENETWKLEVFSLSSGLWRTRLLSKISDLLCRSFKLSSRSECVDGLIYWCASNKDDDTNPSRVIISFDLTREEFGVIYLPDSLARYRILDLSKHRESLVLFPYDYNIVKYGYDVWMMEGGVKSSFKKLFTINTNYDLVTPMAISYNGKVVLEMIDTYTQDVSSVAIYEPSSKRFKWTTITGTFGEISVNSYMETMLLHDYRVGMGNWILL